MLDLYNQKYDRETLKNHIYEVKLIDILKTQKIDVSFAVKYILNDKYQLLKEETKITPNMVLYYQRHISQKALKESLIIYDSENDSVEDFETVSSK